MPRTPTLTFDSSRPDFTPYGFACALWVPTSMPKPDRHNEIELNFLESGSVTYLLGGRRITVEAGRLALFWGAIPHQILRWETTRPYVVVTLPLASFLAWGIPEHLTQVVLAGNVVSEPISNTEDAARFRQWLSDFDSERPARMRVAQLEIQARILRLAAALPAHRARSSEAIRQSDAAGPALSRADQIACHIARNYGEPLTAPQIAKAVGLHPNYAMRLFRKAFGTTIVDFLVQHRLSHAQRLLVTTDEPVIEVAADAGFRSLSRFNEAFKRACGQTPREYRKAHRSDKAPAGPARG